MASRQFFRRLSPILRNGTQAFPAARSAVHMSHQAVLTQNMAYRLTTVRCMSSEVSLKVINIQSEDDFQKSVLESKEPVIVDFHAAWCGPCKLLGPRLQLIIEAEKGKVVLAKVDIDEQVDIAMRFNVQSVPTVFGIKDGSIKYRFIGLKDDDEIKCYVKSLL